VIFWPNFIVDDIWHKKFQLNLMNGQKVTAAVSTARIVDTPNLATIKMRAICIARTEKSNLLSGRPIFRANGVRGHNL
jgi:hypothetical protein